jgi:pimeloyl-ACP methyl ester carboxylesterase
VIREKVVRFGRETKLVGILCEPPAAAGERPAVLLVNSGILHRVGACRFHVRLARRLAEEGTTSLRFDFSGIGDSEVRRDDLAFERSAVAELREAMDHLAAAKGARQFVVIGLCSGADMAFAVALEDARVVGLGVLDPWAYRTPRYFVHHYGPRLLKASVWAAYLRRRLGGRRAEAPAAAAEAPEELDLPTYVREFPPRERAEQDLRVLLERGVKLCTLFSGGQGDHYNYQGQFADAFRALDFRGRLLERHLPEADHIFTDLAHQCEVIDTLAGWLRAGWPQREARPLAAVAASAAAAQA